jgi:hypothetical protein
MSDGWSELLNTRTHGWEKTYSECPTLLSKDQPMHHHGTENNAMGNFNVEQPQHEIILLNELALT